MSASGLARDRQVRARATDGERKSGRTRNKPRIKGSGFPSMTLPSALLVSPVSACLRSLSASWPAHEPSFAPDVINGPGLRWIARVGFIGQSPESRVPLCLLVGR